jgi:hypothetical protein
VLSTGADVPRVTRYTTAKTAAASLVERGVLSGDEAVRTVWRWVRRGVCAAKRLPGERGRVLVGVDADGIPVPVRARRRR